MEEKTEAGGKQPAEKKPDEEEIIDIDLNDPDVHKAAVKIQASFKGHMVRKDNQKMSNSNN